MKFLNITDSKGVTCWSATLSGTQKPKITVPTETFAVYNGRELIQNGNSPCCGRLEYLSRKKRQVSAIVMEALHVFDHIYKTAGTTFNEAYLSRAFEPEQIFVLRGLRDKNITGC